MLNLLFWTALLISIPLRGVNPLYVTAALLGLAIMVIVALLVVGLQHGRGRAERFLGWLGRKLHFDPEAPTNALRQIGARLEELIADRSLLKRVILWASLNWLLDAASLWVFLRAFGGTLDIDALLVAFGLANIFAVIPITPGGLGHRRGHLHPHAGRLRPEPPPGDARAWRRTASPSTGCRSCSAAIMYLSLRVGPVVDRRGATASTGLRDIARRETAESERRIEFTLRQWERNRTGSLPPLDATGSHPVRPADRPGRPGGARSRPSRGRGVGGRRRGRLPRAVAATRSRRRSDR